ncbi:hypothetical protein [Streptomyces sp. ODS28]|uniref:hypothetical protein n=1 Tax=Streptomyces sp. ODS28 TaxID=3136688 RepID=UPI0031ECD1F6
MTWTALALRPFRAYPFRTRGPRLRTRGAAPPLAAMLRRAAVLGEAAAAPSPVEVRRREGRTVIEVHGAIGPAAEPQLGRLLNAVIRPGDTEVVMVLGASWDASCDGARNLLRLAQSLALQREMGFRIVADAEPGAVDPPL